MQITTRNRTWRKPSWPRTALLALGLSVLVNPGCTLNSGHALSESVAITFSQPGFWLPPQSGFYWHSDLVYLYADARGKPEDVRPFLQQEIESYFSTSQHRFTRQRETADFGLVAVVVLGEGMTAREVLQRFSLTPSFQAERRYELGTIVIAILEPGTEKILWRGALQANVDLKLSPEVRRQRVREGISRLLVKLPRQPPDY